MNIIESLDNYINRISNLSESTRDTFNYQGKNCYLDLYPRYSTYNANTENFATPEEVIRALDEKIKNTTFSKITIGYRADGTYRHSIENYENDMSYYTIYNPSIAADKAEDKNSDFFEDDDFIYEKYIENDNWEKLTKEYFEKRNTFRLEKIRTGGYSNFVKDCRENMYC